MMSSIRILSSSIRGVTALTSNQLGPSLGSRTTKNEHSTQSVAVKAHAIPRPISNYAARTFSTHVIQRQTIRSLKAGKSNEPRPELDVPLKPKKPVTPWIMFVRERKDDIIRQHGKIRASEIATMLSREWKQIDRSRYDDEYKRLHDIYKRQVDDYENSLTTEHRDLLEIQKELKREAKAYKLLRKTHPPVLPRNPANLYCQERSKQEDIKERMKTHKSHEVMREIFEEYRSLPESEKKKYIDLREEDKTRFQHDFLTWYEDVQNNETLTKAARDQASAMRDRLRTLKYI